MNIEEAEDIVQNLFNGNIVKEKTIETIWGWVFFSDLDEGKFPVVIFDKNNKKAIRTRAGNMEKKIEVYTKDRSILQWKHNI